MSADRYTRGGAAAHHLDLAYHGELLIAENVDRPGDPGWWSERRFHCPHDHVHAEAAIRCGERAQRHAARTGQPPARWIEAGDDRRRMFR